MSEKFATSDGTSQYVQRFLKKFVENHFRQTQDLWLSSIGIGTYLGEANVPTDKSYTEAITSAVELGWQISRRLCEKRSDFFGLDFISKKKINLS